MSRSMPPVLVAGAGPSGLIVALTLLQNDVPVRIVDKEPHHRIGERGSGLWHRTFEAFHFLRVHEIHQRATQVIPIREYKSGTLEPTKTFSMFTPADPTPSVPYASNNPKFLGQQTLEGILRSHLEKRGCSVELGTELQSFEDVGEHVVAKLAKKRNSEEVFETFEASYLIGTDGAKGVTRKQLGLTFIGETKPDSGSVVGDICLEIKGVDRHHWHFFGNRSADFFMLRPTDDIAADGFQFLISMKAYGPKQLIADESLMFKCMSELLGHEIHVRKIIFMSEFRPNIRMVDSFGRGRVYIAGDAAHVHSPTGGQGLNTCVQDALNLAWKIALVHKGLSPNTLLDSYTPERLPVIAEMLNITTGVLHQIRTAPTIEGAMRREQRMNMLGVNYRASPIVLDAYARPEPVDAYGVLDESVLVAGDRAPDAPALAGVAADGVETRLFDMFGATHHTLLAFAPDPASVADVLDVPKRYPGGVVRRVVVLPEGSEGMSIERVDVFVDRGGHAYRAYLVANGEKKVVVVRPDGFVGAIVPGAEGVGAYFDKIFSMVPLEVAN